MKKTRFLDLGGSRTVAFTPRMYDGLSELARGTRGLEYGTTHVGVPTKRKLAKCGLAELVERSNWDGPMRITNLGIMAFEYVAKMLEVEMHLAIQGSMSRDVL
jgi:hypothetical protein